MGSDALILPPLWPGHTARAVVSTTVPGILTSTHVGMIAKRDRLGGCAGSVILVLRLAAPAVVPNAVLVKRIAAPAAVDVTPVSGPQTVILPHVILLGPGQLCP